MAEKSATEKSEKAKPIPAHIVLLDDWGSHLAGKVLASGADLIAALDVGGTKYRAAKPHEISIAGL